MHSHLARVLVTRGVIRQGTVIQANQQVRGLSCERNQTVLSSFVIMAAKARNGAVFFEAMSAEQQPVRVAADDVVMLDGMDIARIAVAQNLTLEGLEMAMRSRRGRRRKSEIAAS